MRIPNLKRGYKMDTIIVLSPLLKARFDNIVKYIKEQKQPKPDNVSWEEVAFVKMCVVADNYFVKGFDLIH